MSNRFEENAHWAEASFRRILELGGADLQERDHLLSSGISRSRVDALYPLPTFTELLPCILTHLAANIGGWNIARANGSDPLNFKGHKVSLQKDLLDEYFEQSLLIFTSHQYGWIITSSALTEVAPFKDTDMRYLHSLLWHTWWVMVNRNRMEPAAQEYADELMLATIEWVLPGLKASDQPRFFGFSSTASEELY